MATCRACGAEIMFIRMSGKFMPVDPKPVCYEDGSGPEIIVTESGRVTHGIRSEIPMQGRERGYISHFATCTDPDKFRKRGREK